jgi:hypothetical protein
MENNFELSIKQTKACDFLLETPGIEEILYGGAKGGGKTVFLCYAAIFYAEKVIGLCKLKLGQYKYPPVIGFLGRKRGTDFSKTTLETWKKYIPANYCTINEQKKEITLFGLVRYHIGGLDDEENIRKFNSAEYGFIGIDQAEELDRDDAGMLRGTQGRTKINNITIPDKLLFTANPAECFLEQDFGLTEGSVIPDNRKFIQALPSDNEFIDAPKYTAKLIEAWKHHPELIDAYVKGIWGGLKGGTFLFTRDSCDICQRVVPEEIQYPRTLVVCDPAWLGEKVDEIAIYVIRESQIIDKKFMFNEKTTTTAAECVKLAVQYGASLIAVDCIGVGAGVVDNCELLLGPKSRVRVMKINSAGKEDIDDDFLNVRAAMTWYAADLIARHVFQLPLDPVLIDQLCAIKYEIKNGKIKIEDKKDIKSRLGSSPNRSDALIMGLWAKKYCQFDFNTQDEGLNVGQMLARARQSRHQSSMGAECVRR